MCSSSLRGLAACQRCGTVLCQTCLPPPATACETCFHDAFVGDRGEDITTKTAKLQLDTDAEGGGGGGGREEQGEQPPSFDPSRARLLARYCALAYTHDEEALTHVDFGEDGVHYITQSDHNATDRYFVAASEKCVYFVFRGTATLANVLTDLKQHLVPLNWRPPGAPRVSMRVHGGFVESYATLRFSLFEIATSSLCAGKDIVITGHSLGGALATIFTQDLALHRRDLIARTVCYTFGSPRVGDEVFAANHDASVPVSFRCGNENDMITKMPMWTAATPYKHVKRLVCLTKDGFDVEPPRAQGVKEKVSKWFKDKHLGHLNLANHTEYCGATFPSSPSLGGT